jgi:AcrR family transcriptional regulator
MPDKLPAQGTKVKILESALEAYARYGIHDATAKQIAELAGIGKSTIFEYFRSTAELMDEAFALYIGRSAASRGKLHDIAEKDPVAALSMYFDALTGIIVDEPDKLLLLSQYVTAILASGREFADVKREYAIKLLPSADALLEEFRLISSAGIASGTFHPPAGLDATDCALLINAVVREMQSQAFVQDELQIKETCLRLRHIAFQILGVNSSNK